MGRGKWEKSPLTSHSGKHQSCNTLGAKVIWKIQTLSLTGAFGKTTDSSELLDGLTQKSDGLNTTGNNKRTTSDGTSKNPTPFPENGGLSDAPLQKHDGIPDGPPTK